MFRTVPGTEEALCRYYNYYSRLFIPYDLSVPLVKPVFYPFLGTHKAFYVLCMFPRTVCSAWNTLILFLCLEKSYFTFFSGLSWFLAFKSSFLKNVKNLPVFHACGLMLEAYVSI